MHWCGITCNIEWRDCILINIFWKITCISVYITVCGIFPICFQSQHIIISSLFHWLYIYFTDTYLLLSNKIWNDYLWARSTAFRRLFWTLSICRYWGMLVAWWMYNSSVIYSGTRVIVIPLTPFVMNFCNSLYSDTLRGLYFAHISPNN